MIKCPNCGKRNPEGNKFCGECGTKLPAPENYCPKCDKTYEWGEKFCTECGEKLVNKEEYREKEEKKRKKEEEIFLEYEIKDSLFEELYFEFKDMNTTTDTLFHLGEYEVLIILKDGRNLTDWNDVENIDDVLYISEDFSNKNNVDGCYFGFSSVKFIVMSNITRDVTDMSTMFIGCSSLVAIYSFGDFDVSNVTDMSHMFDNCFSLVDISALTNWNISKVENMNSMFLSCKSLTDISALANWDVSKVKGMNSMFYSCESLKDVSALKNWKTLNITQLKSMFEGCMLLENISSLSNWDVSKVENMEEMFLRCESLKNLNPLNNWNVSNTKNMNKMFEGCTSLTDISPLNNWKVKYSCETKEMFDEIPNLKKFPDWYFNMSESDDFKPGGPNAPIIKIHLPGDLNAPIIKIPLPEDYPIIGGRPKGAEFIEGKTKEELMDELEFVTRQIEYCQKSGDYMIPYYKEKKKILEKALGIR